MSVRLRESEREGQKRSLLSPVFLSATPPCWSHVELTNATNSFKLTFFLYGNSLWVSNCKQLIGAVVAQWGSVLFSWVDSNWALKGQNRWENCDLKLVLTTKQIWNDIKKSLCSIRKSS